MDDIDAMFSDMMQEMDLLTQVCFSYPQEGKLANQCDACLCLRLSKKTYGIASQKYIFLLYFLVAFDYFNRTQQLYPIQTVPV